MRSIAMQSCPSVCRSVVAGERVPLGRQVPAVRNEAGCAPQIDEPFVDRSARHLSEGIKAEVLSGRRRRGDRFICQVADRAVRRDPDLLMGVFVTRRKFAAKQVSLNVFSHTVSRGLKLDGHYGRLGKTKILINTINMKNSDDIAELTITAEDACHAVGISQATLYAYVSRGLVRAGTDPKDERRSLYDRRDIAALLARQRRPRARKDVAASTLNWGEPSLPSSVSTIVDGKLYYRGQDAITLSKTATYDEIANLLCGMSPSKEALDPLPSQSRDGIDRMLAVMAHHATASDDRDTQDVSNVLRSLVNAACGAAANEGDTVEQQLTHALSVPKEALGILRQALVLCADHELNPSTYAARVATSTGASLPAAITAALATFSGSGHGRLPMVCREWILRHQNKSKSADWRESGTPPGFGHRLYPDGDPRGGELLRVLPIPNGVSQLADEVLEKTGAHPNIDFALAVFELTFDLKLGSASTLFATGRSCGWIAHFLEQRELGQHIRPRAYGHLQESKPV